MPTKHERRTVLYTADEAADILREMFETGMSFSNVARKRQGLSPFARGGKLKKNPSPSTLYQRKRRAKLKDR